jgi:hypothetical protein
VYVSEVSYAFVARISYVVVVLIKRTEDGKLKNDPAKSGRIFGIFVQLVSRHTYHHKICIGLFDINVDYRLLLPQLDDDPIVSKHLAVCILYKVVFDGYFSTPYFTD